MSEPIWAIVPSTTDPRPWVWVDGKLVRGSEKLSERG